MMADYDWKPEAMGILKFLVYLTVGGVVGLLLWKSFLGGSIMNLVALL